jgi:hypothetical protein
MALDVCRPGAPTFAASQLGPGTPGPLLEPFEMYTLIGSPGSRQNAWDIREAGRRRGLSDRTTRPV